MGTRFREDDGGVFVTALRIFRIQFSNSSYSFAISRRDASELCQ
jgi:hypothetical protein